MALLRLFVVVVGLCSPLVAVLVDASERESSATGSTFRGGAMFIYLLAGKNRANSEC